MDYSGILKRAWNLTWKYKILWLFGLFVGGGSGGSRWNSGSSSNFSPSTSPGTSTQNPFPGLDATTMQRYLPLIAVGVVLLIVIGLAWFILSVAARGGLVYLVDQVEDGRQLRARDGWRVGFHYWGRVFLLYLLLGLPVFLVALVAGGVFAIAIAGAGAGAGSSQQGALAALSAVSGACCFGAILLVVVIALSVVLGVIGELGLRYAVLRDMGAVDALKAGWADLKAKRGAFVMFLILFGVGIAYGIIVGVIAIVLLAPAYFAIIGGAWAVAGLMGLLVVLILLVPGAVFGTFQSAAWTIFFRRMTGMEPAAGVALGGPAPAPYGGGYPPAPPASGGSSLPQPPAERPFPPAPPVAPAPPAPPVTPQPPAGPQPPVTPESADSAPVRSDAPAGWAPWLPEGQQDAGAEAAQTDPWKAANGLPEEPPSPQI